MPIIRAKSKSIKAKEIFSAEKEFFFKFKSLFLPSLTVVVAQLVRASDCGSEGRRFEPGHPPKKPCTRLFYFV